jgi:hypothetical protein
VSLRQVHICYTDQLGRVLNSHAGDCRFKHVVSLGYLFLQASSNIWYLPVRREAKTAFVVCSWGRGCHYCSLYFCCYRCRYGWY